MLSFRPHHFLCALGFKGLGYSDEFAKNMRHIVFETLRAENGDDTVIAVTAHSDAICAPCPQKRGAHCESEAKIATLDRAHASALKLSAGNTLSWGEAKARIKSNVFPGDLATICAGCQWLSLGACEQALSALHKKTPLPEGGGA